MICGAHLQPGADSIRYVPSPRLPSQQAEEYVPLPKGDVHKKKEIVQDVTLHDLDVANARPQVRRSLPRACCCSRPCDYCR